MPKAMLLHPQKHDFRALYLYKLNTIINKTHVTYWKSTLPITARDLRICEQPTTCRLLPQAFGGNIGVFTTKKLVNFKDGKR